MTAVTLLPISDVRPPPLIHRPVLHRYPIHCERAARVRGWEAMLLAREFARRGDAQSAAGFLNEAVWWQSAARAIAEQRRQRERAVQPCTTSPGDRS